MARVRIHQHVNPLSPYYRQEPEPIDISAVFADPTMPLLLDIGCARGRFLLKMAEVDVNHRERKAGTSKYTNLDRAIRGVYDLVGVCWLLKRKVILPPLEAGKKANSSPS